MFPLSFPLNYETTCQNMTVKMRAIADGPTLNKNFFIIMDRLYQRLDMKIKEWNNIYTHCKGNIFGMGSNKEELKHLMVERLVVAFDLSQAFDYMHDNQ